MCSGSGTPGNNTSSSGKMGNNELTTPPVKRFYAIKKVLREPGTENLL
jgi:hypothetical protein